MLLEIFGEATEGKALANRDADTAYKAADLDHSQERR